MDRASRPRRDPDETLLPQLMPRRRQTPDAVVAIAAAAAAAEAQR